jgi:hypothetical protein
MAALMSLSICVFKLIPICFGGKVTSRIAEEKRSHFPAGVERYNTFEVE